MRVHLSITLALISLSTVTHTDLANAQAVVGDAGSTSLFSSNPLRYFNFDPVEAAKFLFSSMRPEYRERYQKMVNINNTSKYIVGMAKMIIGENRTLEILKAPVVQKLLDVIDSEMVDIFRNMSLRDISVDHILSRLARFDWTEVGKVLMDRALWDMQTALPNITEKVNSTLRKLEKDVSIADDLTQQLQNQGFKFGFLNASIAHLDVALRNLTKALMGQPEWMTTSDLGKLRQLFIKFNYAKFGEQTIKTVYQGIQDSLPKTESDALRSFFIRLERYEPLNVSGAAMEYLPLAYNYTREMLLARKMNWLPEHLPLNLDVLENYGLFRAIELELFDAIKEIYIEKNTSLSIWLDIRVPDVERLAFLLSKVNYNDIGQRLMGNALNTISNDAIVTPGVHQLVQQVFAGMNLSSKNEGFINSTATLIVRALQESKLYQESQANYTTLPNSEKLQKVLTGIDYSTFMARLFVEVVNVEETLLPATFKATLAEVFSLVRDQNRTELEDRIMSQVNMIDRRLLNATFKADLLPVQQAVAGEITRQLIDTYQLMLNGNNTMGKRLLQSSNLTFSALSEPKKLMYVVASVDFSAIGMRLMDTANILIEDKISEFLAKLEREESIKPDIKDFITRLQELPLVGARTRAMVAQIMNSSLMNAALEDINDQMTDLYKKFSTNSTAWTAANHTSGMKLIELLSAYNYTTTGNKITWQLLPLAEARLPASMKLKLDELISRVEAKKSVIDILEDVRRTLVDAYPTLRWITKDTMMPVYKAIDSHIQQLDQKEIVQWKATPGKLQKLARLLLSLNNTELSTAMMKSINQLALNAVVDQIVLPLSQNNSELMEEFMNIIESGGMVGEINQYLQQMAANSSELLQVLQTNTIQGVLQSLSASVSHTLVELKQSTGSRWQTFTSTEKLVRLTVAINWNMTMTNAFEAMKAGLKESIIYYTAIIRPTFSQSCTWDMANVSYALMRPMDPKSMWAMKLVDAWGKLPPGVLQGGFTWPGDMKECEGVEGNRTLVLANGTQVVLEEYKLKGEWSMATITLPKFGGAGGLLLGGRELSLSWGFCLPASCNYDDRMKFMGRVNLLGANLTAIKSTSMYPSRNGAYKTDAKFIGVTAFFCIITAIVIICTTYDRVVLRKETEKNLKEGVYSLTSIKPHPEKNGTAFHKASDIVENSTMLYRDAEKAHANGGYVHGDDEKPEMNGDFRAAAAKQNGGISAKPNMSAEKKKSGILVALVKSFSLYETVPKLMDSAPKPNQLQALDCIRFLSMTWVILGHVLTFPMAMPVTKNMMAAAVSGNKGDWTFMGISGGVFAVDSFFLLSGLLVGYLFLKALHKVKGKPGCLMLTLYYVHRVLRLLPLYAGVILITVAYSNYSGSGPFNTWFTDEIKNPCDSYWWRNLLYINNLFKPEESCVGVTWYLANDMQFYVISPLLLIPLYRAPKIGIAMISALFGAHLAVSGYLWTAGDKKGGSLFSDLVVFDDIYNKPWCRIGPYLIGLLLAFILFKRLRIKSGLMQLIWWIASLGIIAVCIYIPYDATKEGGIFTSSWNVYQRAIYETLCRNAWAIALGWIIFACNTGCGGVFADVMNWSGFAPLSRLTYAAYLIHYFLIVDINYKNRQNLIYIDMFGLVFDNISFVILSYMFAAVLHLLLEAPMLGLEKLILPRRK